MQAVRFMGPGIRRTSRTCPNLLLDNLWVNGGRRRTRTCDLLRVKQAL